VKIGLDTNVVVALLSGPHAFHERTWTCFEDLREGGAELVLPGQVLLESFAVLTRLPEPNRMLPSDAEQALRHTFSDAIITGVAKDPWAAIHYTVSRGHYGGRVYDTAIALAAFEAGARVLLSWNVKHFLTIVPFGLEVREP
jgi:predicted nucleic acid-binding protein